MALLALGQTGEEPTADTDRGDLQGKATILNHILLSFTILTQEICTRGSGILPL